MHPLASGAGSALAARPAGAKGRQQEQAGERERAASWGKEGCLAVYRPGLARPRAEVSFACTAQSMTQTWSKAALQILASLTIMMTEPSLDTAQNRPLRPNTQSEPMAYMRGRWVCTSNER